MEQGPALTMATATPRSQTPVPSENRQGSTNETAATRDPTAESGMPAVKPSTEISENNEDAVGVETRSQDEPKSDATSLQTTAQRAFQNGLSRENLEQEVNQVMGTFNSWWGGLKKQSATAYTSLKAEVDKTVSQAQADLEHLRTAKIEVGVKDTSLTRALTGEEQPADDIKGKGKAKEESSSPIGEKSSEDQTPGTTLLNRITSSTNQIQQSLQSTIQSTIASAQSNPALSNPNQLRAQIAENLRLSSAKENLQLSMKQAEKLAEEYMKKGDQWIKGAEKWMEEAVKVLPPDDDDEARYVATTWDAGDFYSFSTSSSARSKVQKGDVLFDVAGRSSRSGVPGAVVAASRKESLLRRLREDKDLLLVDPEGEGESEERKAEFKQFIEKQWPELSKQGKEKEEAHVGTIRMELVPESLSDEQFWQRYLFHKSMIEAEDEKRKKVLEASQEAQQEDFNWDDEDDASPSSPVGASAGEANPRSSTTTLRPPASNESEQNKEADQALTTPKAPSETQVPKHAGVTGASTSTSPRDSEESYDLVSDQGGKGGKGASKPAAPSQQDDDEDSDWE
ncbi:hypothetical protein BD324DRAFT_593306 [Kockovaella imperatae]|uniref:BSD domain-containing protein n=1 Tax=Kockovaella imperatae TaxID=4999 RepID=A0A1Y1UD14_9TREE|nr:hypothetical protein BD324DRAFT_593306 [Kockovaella imperatae]ORX34955.1 hypothetical protein BD324DRAFT_593306 [Kockovaella imperatae]